MSDDRDALIVQELNRIDGIDIGELHELDMQALDPAAADRARDVLLACIPWSPSWETDRTLVRLVGEAGGDEATSAQLGVLFVNAERPWMLDVPSDARRGELARERHNVAEEGMGRTLTEGTLDLVAPLITHRDFSPRARGSLCRAVPRCRQRDRAIGLMVRLVEDDHDMRMHAISTLRTLRAVETREVVERFADDADEAVRKEATITLARFDRLEAS